MAFAINQNFDLKSKRKDFVRQELTLEQLKTTRDADYPDDYQVVIGGKIYIFNSANPVDPTLGKWKEFKSGPEVKAGAGLTMDAGGTMSVKLASKVTDGIDPGLEVDDKGLRLKLKTDGGIRCTQNGELHVPLGEGLWMDGHEVAVNYGAGLTYPSSTGEIYVDAGDGIDVSDVKGVSVKTGKGLKIDENKAVALNIGSNLQFDEKGALCVDVPSLIVGTGLVTEGGSVGVQVGSGLQTNKDNKLEVKIGSTLEWTGSKQDEINVRVGEGLRRYDTGLCVYPGAGIYIDTQGRAGAHIGTGLTFRASHWGTCDAPYTPTICVDPIQKQQLYYDDGNNAVVPFKHPDISTQPSILPYKFMGQYVYEQLIPIDDKDKSQLLSTGRVNLSYWVVTHLRIKVPLFLEASIITHYYPVLNDPRYEGMFVPCIYPAIIVGRELDSQAGLRDLTLTTPASISDLNQGDNSLKTMYLRVVYTSMPADGSCYGYNKY